MVRRCSVGGCGNTARDGVSLHGFPPLLTALRKLWISRVKTTRRDWKAPARTSLVCSAHFREDDFDPSERLKVSMGLTPPVRFLRRLLPTAAPSLFMRHITPATWTPKATSIMIGEAHRQRQRQLNRVRLFRPRTFRRNLFQGIKARCFWCGTPFILAVEILRLTLDMVLNKL